MAYTFGPIHSRRFGLSLGIDLSPFMKQCNYDCLYCELASAKTLPKQTTSASVEEILQEVEKKLNDKVEVVTITANGEPTLYPYLGELVEGLKKIQHNAKTLILSNSSTLNQPKVFQTLLHVDKVKLSLDAVSQDIFQKIDRPYNKMDIRSIIDAMKQFCKVYKGELYIEVLFVKNINDKPDEIEKINQTLLGFENITRVDIGTIDRPPAFDVKPLEYDRLYEIAKRFSPLLPLHIVSRKHTEGTIRQSYTTAEILSTLKKRPLTYEDIELLFDESARQRLEELVTTKLVEKKSVGGVEFFVCNS